MPAYSSTTGLYLNKKHREIMSASITAVAISYFKKAFSIQNFNTLVEQVERTFRAMEQNDRQNLFAVDERFYDEYFMDIIKITICFENYFKAVLIKKGYLVHLVVNKTAGGKFRPLGTTSQKPVRVSEYKKIERYYLDITTGNYEMRGLSKSTISFHTITKNHDYLKLINCPTDILNIIMRLYKVRNSLHLKEFNISGVSRNQNQDLKKLILFVNKEMIGMYNKISKRYSFNRIIDQINIT